MVSRKCVSCINITINLKNFSSRQASLCSFVVKLCSQLQTPATTDLPPLNISHVENWIMLNHLFWAFFTQHRVLEFCSGYSCISSSIISIAKYVQFSDHLVFFFCTLTRCWVFKLLEDSILQIMLQTSIDCYFHFSQASIYMWNFYVLCCERVPPDSVET